MTAGTMRAAQVLAFAKAFCACSPSPLECVGDDTQPLVDATAVEGDAGRYVVALEGPDSSFCTGTQLTDRVVLTARHCLLGAEEVEIRVQRAACRPRCPVSTMAVVEHSSADLAVLRANEPLGRHPAPPLELAEEGDALPERLLAFGYGHGTVRWCEGTKSVVPGTVLLQSGIQVQRWRNDSFTATALEGTAIVCDGDSGGPALSLDGGKVVGVLSYSGENRPEAPCTALGEQQVWVRVDQFRAWLSAQVDAR